MKGVAEVNVTKSQSVLALKRMQGLHRSAYSFGGLKDPLGGGVNSSQQKKNLIFGTVETNTLMIR
jgi:hypothetical protein